ncbi:RNA-directed DNA polymerase, eukaryota, Reverse transcriptase zinc-binding domain protein [Artemisia annua]|uniref:RNA-directed DNA polymerase, eukaryota, Reverse transcriptase zinc-binding domain protein n=1 Tax=Artemisia annua TaxID=35608 RepID=A0A2U1PDN3_ARTAN|nr:RNA-directed DNA polymerase, eukaryota, Reverse transcriptase zinc-binding domain protein [Artemisia annua]
MKHLWNDVLLMKHLLNIAAKKDTLRDKWVSMVKLKNMSVWWHVHGPLSKYITKRNIYEARLNEDETVASMIYDRQWKWLKEWEQRFLVLKFIKVLVLNEKKYKVIWRNNNGANIKFKISEIWKYFRCNDDDVPWHRIVWYNQCNPRYAFIIWLAVQGRLLTQDRMMAWCNNPNMRIFQKQNQSIKVVLKRWPCILRLNSIVHKGIADWMIRISFLENSC